MAGFDPTERYLALLRAALTHTLYEPVDTLPYPPANPALRRLQRAVRGQGLGWFRHGSRAKREVGQDWPVFGQTMGGLRRLEALQRVVETVIAEDVPGDLIETGTWRGGAAIMMRAVLAARGDTERSVWVADSFAGLPPPDLERWPQDEGGHWHLADELAVSLGEVQENFRRCDLLDDRVRFLEGWFQDTLPTVRDRTWAVIRLDGDMYGSTMTALQNLYPRLAPGGFAIIDDYEIANCRRAVDDYRAEHGIAEPLQTIDWTGVLWRRDC